MGAEKKMGDLMNRELLPLDAGTARQLLISVKNKQKNRIKCLYTWWQMGLLVGPSSVNNLCSEASNAVSY